MNATLKYLVCAGAISAEGGGQLLFLRRVLLAPEELKENFWPSMQDDPLHMAMQALMAVGADFGVAPFGIEAQRVLRLEKAQLLMDGCVTLP